MWVTPPTDFASACTLVAFEMCRTLLQVSSLLRRQIHVPAGDTAVVGHTWVDPRHRGGTLAPSLVDAVVAWARAGNRKIVPACSYVRRVFTSSKKFDDVWSR
jgi:GNAT superfamily N-acetyltransferase